MIKVLHSELQDNIGGIESFLLNLTKCINREEFQFDMLMRGNNQYLESNLEKLGVKIYKVPTNIIEYYKFLKKLLISKNYDYVHVHKNSAANILLPIMVKKYSKAKLIIHSHNTNPSSGSHIAIMLHKINRRKLLKLSDYRYACSDTAAKWMYGKNYKSENVIIVKNGILVNDYIYNPGLRRKTRTELNLNGKYVIGHVGAFRKQKNHQFLIELFSKLNLSNSELILVGDGPLRHEVEKQVKDLGIENKVKFLGSRHDVSNLLQAMDIFVMPSLWEGLSISTIEAQTSGLPLILSNKVSRLSALTNKVEFLSLKDINQWIREIKIVKHSNFTRQNESRIIQSSGYDMKVTAKKIEKTYESNM